MNPISFSIESSDNTENNTEVEQPRSPVEEDKNGGSSDLSPSHEHPEDHPKQKTSIEQQEETVPKLKLKSDDELKRCQQQLNRSRSRSPSPSAKRPRTEATASTNGHHSDESIEESTSTSSASAAAPKTEIPNPKDNHINNNNHNGKEQQQQSQANNPLQAALASLTSQQGAANSPLQQVCSIKYLYFSKLQQFSFFSTANPTVGSGSTESPPLGNFGHGSRRCRRCCRNGQPNGSRR